jgi:hypothetical protein
MALYSSDDGNYVGATCPLLTEVGIDFGTRADMLDIYDCNDYIEDTPTRESLTAVAEALAAQDLEGPKVIVLATDGLPDNCECPEWDDESSGGGMTYDHPQCDPGDSDNDVDYDGDDYHAAGTYEVDEYEQIQVVLEAQRIFAELGIQIEVINVSSPGDTALATHLDNVADAGGAVSGASIDGFDPGALSDAFQSIIDGVRSCAIDLDGTIEAGKESTGTVTLDGDVLILDDPDGWQVNTPTQIELLGAACETIKSGDHDLDISFPCGSFRPPVLK